MALSHLQLIEKAECELHQALITGDRKELERLLSKDMVYTNEMSRITRGVDALHILTPAILTFSEISVLKKDIDLFDSVAVVNSTERRSGLYLGLQFDFEYHLIRTWKFRSVWKLIAAITMTVNDGIPQPNAHKT